MCEKPLSNKSIIIWKVRYTAASVLACFFLGGVAIFSVKIAGVLLSVLFVLYISIILLYLPLRFKNTCYRLEKNYLTIKKGVFFLQKIVIEVKKVQYVSILQTPEQKAFGVATIIFHTAGEKISLSQVELEEANFLKRQIYGALL